MNGCCEQKNTGCQPTPPGCLGKTGTSTLFYDGPDLAGICIKRGMSLNALIAQINSVMIQLGQQREEFHHEVFCTVEVSGSQRFVTLEHTPYKVIAVIYCGVIIPANSYEAFGRQIQFAGSLCMVEGREVVVLYQSSFEARCREVNVE
jgi:hypothetical protein